MGIDIYLNGYDSYEKRSASQHKAFDKAVTVRDKLPEDSAARAAAQKVVSEAADAMWSAKVGYLRSSYNGSGLFRVLEEIFGFDIAEYFFPGDWDKQGDDGIPINGEEFCRKVEALQKTTVLAMQQHHLDLPWIEQFTQVTGEKAPDPNPAHSRAEEFGDSVFRMVSSLGMDKVEGGPVEPPRKISQQHFWYLTSGLRNLLDFGLLAKQLNDAGEKTFAYISF